MKNKLTLIVSASSLLGLLLFAGCGGSDNNSSLSSGGNGGGSGNGGGGTPSGSQVIGLWATTSVGTGGNAFMQQDRLARPIVNEALATFANNRHRINNTDTPRSDKLQLKRDIESFLTFPAGRSTATKNVIEAVLVPDVMKADLSQTGPAAYLGVETNGATGGKFGGRKLEDDVVDISLGIVFGPTISALGLAPDDHKEIPTLTKDNVGPSNNRQNTFPYLIAPR